MPMPVRCWPQDQKAQFPGSIVGSQSSFPSFRDGSFTDPDRCCFISY